MQIDPEQETERVGPNQLYFLSHPGSELFSGYGLTTISGRSDRLTGLLMLDRLNGVDRTWLDRVEAQYGDYQLVPMPESGERGMLAQMLIEPSSLQFMERFYHPVERDLKHVLSPFLDIPPSPILKLRWDEPKRTWQIDFWIGLPPDLQTVLEDHDSGCMTTESSDGTITFAAHISATDMDSLRVVPVVYDWQFEPFPVAPSVRFFAAVLEDPFRPLYLEHSFSVDDRVHARHLTQLADQPWLNFDVYDPEYEYRYSRTLPHPITMRERLDDALRQAGEWRARRQSNQVSFDFAGVASHGWFPQNTT